MTHLHWQSISLSKLQRVKKWHVLHKADHPLEYQLLDAVLTIWIMGWVGLLPVFVLDAEWCLPFSLLAMTLPNLYIGWRIAAHNAQRLRCDWVNQLG